MMAEISLSKQEIQRRLNTITIRPDGFSGRNYGISIKYYSKDEKQVSKRVDYEAEMTLKVNNGVGEISIDKKNVFFNQHEPDMMSEIVSDAISKSIYPVKTFINEKGISGNEILNHKEIVDRWNDQKSKLSEKYESEYFSDILKRIDDKIEQKAELEKGLRHDWFWNLFFHPKFVNYGPTREREIDLYLSIVPYKDPIKFAGIQRIEKIPTAYHSFVVDFRSEELLAPNYFNIKNNIKDGFLFMSLKVTFDMDLYHHFAMNTRACFEVFSKNEHDKKEIVERIDFTMYQINSDEYRNKVLDNKSPFISGGLVKLPPNKWGFDNFENLENDW
ncbi:hypothetical protein NG800_006930 [Epilithonimonas ginsengisoli]|uniref:Uncharacterized protein n=1 Tax=Epilithonimonas ginsengisoli TaxID=1245592 RepID=A0ABU4JG34_9FLAO|nr:MULTISPECIES: hypothetical protein [Chryseobacterium group]MDW8548638.1 hypothetical protein [Epilithonimonas ginsengisoli]